jgi:putative ABC transport system substrate-binding protein
LIGYGAAEAKFMRQVAGQVDKILKGAKPADLPVEQPTYFEPAINLKTAKGPRPDDSTHAPRPRRRGD